MLDDWGDITPSVITIAEDVAPSGAYSPAVVGPDASPSSGEMPNAIKGRLRVGVTGDYLVLDPFDPLRFSLYDDGTEKIRVGNLNGFLGYDYDVYGIAIGSGVDYLKYAGGILLISGAIQGGTIAIGGSDASSFHVDASGNIWLGAAAFSSAPFRVSPNGDLVASSAIIGGVMTGVMSGVMTGVVNALSGYSANVTLGKTGVVSGTLTLQLADGLGDTYIASGKADFTNVDSGFILGIDDSDANTPKFYIGNSAKYLNWDGAALTGAGMTLINVNIASTAADAFTINSDLGDVNADLVFGRTTGGSATFRWDGYTVTLDKPFSATAFAMGGTTANTFTVNSDGTDTNVSLVLGRTTGGNAAITYDGSTINIDQNTGIYGTVLTLNTPLGDYSSQLIFGRTTGGNGTLTYNGTNFAFNKPLSISGTTSDTLTINSDNTDANIDLIFGRGTGGNATIRWNGSVLYFDAPMETWGQTFLLNNALQNYNVDLIFGRTTGGNATLRWNGTTVGIDKSLTVTGGFGCNAAAAQTAYASGGALNAYATGVFGFDSSANASALHAMVVSIRAALVAVGIMS